VADLLIQVNQLFLTDTVGGYSIRGVPRMMAKNPILRKGSEMKAQTRTKLALFGGVAALAIAVSGAGIATASSTTTTAGIIVTPAPAPTAAPKGPATGKSTKGFVVAPVVFPERTTS
jgi:hypothetical protein